MSFEDSWGSFGNDEITSKFECSWCCSTECEKYKEGITKYCKCKECGNIYVWAGLGEWELLETGEYWEENE